MTEHALGADQGLPFPITVRIREPCRLTRIGRSKLYQLIAAGEIEIVKVGTMTLIPTAALQRFLDQQAERLR